MMIILPINQPLRNNFPITEKHLSQDVLYLLEIRNSGINRYSTIKLINILRRNGLRTIGDIVNAEARRIQLMKGVGEKTFATLLELLKCISQIT